jgi:hypothetical protein
MRTAAYQTLSAKTKPADASLPEALPYVLYDTQTYPLAGQVADLQFFTTVNADKTLSNIETPNSLPAPQFFDIHRIFLDFLSAAPVSNAAAPAGVANDIELILKTARMTFTFTLASKVLGPIPATFLGYSGGASAQLGTTSAANTAQQANGSDNGGFPVNGAITLPPTQTFRLTASFQSTLVPVSQNTLLRVSFLGVLYRKVA